MSMRFKPNDGTDQYNTEDLPKLTIRHSTAKKRSPYPEKSLFKPLDIASQTDTYEIFTPKDPVGDAMLTLQNPGLLALRNKTSKGGRPELASPKSKPRTQSGTHSILVSRRPLTSLKEPPTVAALEIGKKQVELEKQIIDFKEDPVAYFSKRKDGRGHRFIYLVRKSDPSDPNYSPYELEKVPFAGAREDYFTMSATGVTHVCSDGTTETMSLEEWSDESSKFNAVRRLKLFAKFSYWKPLQIWKNFVMHQRYGQLDGMIVRHAFFKNKEFFARGLYCYDLQRKLRGLLEKYLLDLHSQSKFRLKEFEHTNKSNIEKLKLKYDKFVFKIQEEVNGLYAAISDPKLVEVHDSDFPDTQRKDPNLAQLMLLEKRKSLMRAQRTDAVNHEIMAIGGFIRMVDYMILEELSEGCIECFKMAERNVVADGAAVFQVDVYFTDDGKVEFRPTLDDLLSTISTTLKEAVKTLNQFPRVLAQVSMRPFLRDNGLDLNQLFNDGPQFLHIVKCSDILEVIEAHVLETVKTSYMAAHQFSQSFGEFYPIYRMGQTWNVRDYVSTRGGARYEGPFIDQVKEGDQQDEILMKPDEQPVVEFDRLAADIVKFRKDLKSVANMRGGAVKGAVYVDSRGLKTDLGPIPDQALKELQETLTNITQTKIDKVMRALKFYSKHLKLDPKDLEEFVEFCDILKRTAEVSPRIEAEIEFVDRMFKLFDDCNMVRTHNSNPLHSAYAVFKTDRNQATSTREGLQDMFKESLRASIGTVEKKISKYFAKATTIPPSLKETDVDVRIPAAEKLVGKINAIEPRVRQLINFQSIIEVNLNQFEGYKDAVEASKFAVRLYETVERWQKLNDMMTKVPFSNVNMETFKGDIQTLKDDIEKLQSECSAKYPVLDELLTKVTDILPFVEQLDQLSRGKMQERHWAMLFKECGKANAYNADISIRDLLNLNILQETDKIEKITQTSQGESQLETEFIELSEYWKKVQMPLAETQIKTEETLLLGDTEPLLREIGDALRTLARMLSLPYVQEFREPVANMSSTLENLCRIIEVWQKFQSNWIILSSLFSLGETKAILPVQTSSFNGIQRKWSAIARHTLKDTHLLAVCAFPSLLDVLKENNESMELILTSLSPFIDAKRAQIPRLYFLSNDEVLTLMTTSDFHLMMSIVTKMFMNVASFNCHEKDGGDGELSMANIQRIRITGIVGEDGDVLPLGKNIQLNQPMDVWVSQLIDSMHSTVKDNIIAAIPGCDKGSFTDWVMSTNTYVAVIALYVVFCQEMEGCFSTYETNSKAFSQYVSMLIRRIADVADSFLMPLSPVEKGKLSAILTLLLGMRDRANVSTDKVPGYSPYIDWLTSLRFRYVQNNGTVQLEYADAKWEHGYEYWGKIPRMAHTDSVGRVIANICDCSVHNQLPMLTSTTGQGKQLIANECACLFGRFAYTIRSFPDISEYFLSRILIGSVSTGSWAVFSDVDTLPHNVLCYLFDSLRAIVSACAVGAHKVALAGKATELQRTCKILLTADANYMHHENVPPQLRSYARPIALSAPDLTTVVETRLAAEGMRDFRTLGPKLASFLKEMANLYSCADISCSPLNVLAGVAPKFGALANKMKGKITEDVALCWACMDHFAHLGDEKRVEALQNCLQSSFQIGSSVKEMMDKIDTFKKELEYNQLLDALTQEAGAMKLETVSEYICERALALYELLKQHKLVAIVGPVNSGKSTVLEILRRVLRHGDTQTAVGMKAMEVVPIFPGSTTEGTIYGATCTDSTGVRYSYGQVHSALWSLRNSDSSFKVLKFDGSLTRRVSLFLSNYVGGPSDETLMLNSLDTFSLKDGYRVIIETDDLSMADPSMVARCGLLLMRNIQTESPLLVRHPKCETTHPELPLSRAVARAYDIAEQIDLATFTQLFCVVTPNVVNRIYRTVNDLCYLDATSSVKDAHVLICDVLPMYAALLAMRVIVQGSVDQSAQDQVKVCILVAYARVLSGILHEKEMQEFEIWMRATYALDIPIDWVGFNVSAAFSSVFPRPSLLSLRMYQGKLIPLNFSQMEGRPISPQRAEEELPLLIDEMTVCHPQILPAQRICDMMMLNKQNIIVHGPHDSGKSSFLKILFNGKNNIIPIVIPVNNLLTGERIVNHVITHTSLISKSLDPSLTAKTYVLVFEGLESQHTQAMEFIRMIVTNHTIPLTSPNDQKVLEFASLHNFMVIVTTRDCKSLPVRFLAHFVPVALPSITEKTAQFIGQKIMTSYGYKAEDAEAILKAIASVLSQFPSGPVSKDIFRLLPSLCFGNGKENRDTMLHTVLAGLFYVSLHKCSSDFTDKVAFICKAMCQTYEEKTLVDEFLRFKLLNYPAYEFSKDQKVIEATIVSKPQMKLAEELREFVKVYNSGAEQKLSMRFWPHVANEWMVLMQAISLPGKNVVLEGRTGSGRYTMTRLIAENLKLNFVAIPERTVEEALSIEDRRTGVCSKLKELVLNLVEEPKRTLIFLRGRKDNQREVQYFTNFIATGELISLFDNEELEKLYSKFSGGYGLGYEERQAAIRKVQTHLKLNICVVIELENDAGYEVDRANFDHIVFNSDTPEVFNSVTTEAIESQDMKRIVGASAGTVQKAFLALANIAKKYISHFHPNMFYDFVDWFTEICVRDFEALQKSKEDCQSGIHVISKLETDARNTDKKLEELAPQLKTLQEEYEKLELSYTSRKEAMDIRREKLAEEHQSRTTELEGIAKVLDELERNKQVLTVRVDRTRRDVDALSDNDIETMRITAADPKPALRLLLELCCVFMDLPPSYEKSGQKLLMDPRFVSNMITRVSENPITEAMISNAKQYLEDPELNADDLEAIAPALHCFYTWVESIYQQAELHNNIEKQKKLLQEKQKGLADYEEEMNMEMTAIKQVEAQLEVESKTLKESNEARQKIESEYKALEERKANLNAIFKNIDQFTDRWRSIAGEFSSKKEQLLGDVILFAFYLAFCGSLDVNQADNLLEEVRKSLQDIEIQSSGSSAMQAIRDRLILLHPEDHAVFDSAALDVYHATTAKRWPMLIDPDGIVTEMIMGSVNPKELVTISHNCSNLELVLANCIADGKKLVLLDVDELNPLVRSILPVEAVLRGQNATCEILVGQRRVTWNPNFKLLLVSTFPDAKLPDPLLSRVTLVNVTASSLESTYAAFVDTFVNFFYPELSPKIFEMKKQKIGHRAQVQNYEKRVLDIVARIVANQNSNSEYDCLTDKPTVTELIQMKDAFIETVNSPINDTQEMEQLKTLIDPFVPHVKLCQTFWKVMSRFLPVVNNSAKFVFSQYRKTIASVFVNDGLHPGSLSEEQHAALHQALIVASFQFVFPSLPIKDSLFTMFMSSYLVKEDAGKVQGNMLNEVLDHIRTELNKKCDFQSVPSQSGDVLENLKNSNVVNLFHYVAQFIAEQFGPEFPSFIPVLQAESVIASAASIPTIVVSEEIVNPTALLQHFIGLRCKHDNMESISLSDDVRVVRAARKSLTTAMTRGNWVIVHYSRPSRAAAAMLTDIFTQMTTASINTNFRLIIIAASLEYMSYSMISQANRINIETFPCIRTQTLRVFHQYSSLIRSTSNSKAMKKLAYICALLLSFIEYRNFLQPVSYSGYVRASGVAFVEIVEVLSSIIDAHPNDIPLGNLCRQIERLIYSNVADAYDKKRILAVLHRFLVPRVLEDGFSLAENSPESDKWIIPGDIPLASFTSIIEQIPLVPSPDVLQISGTGLQNWNMSLWACLPFVKFSHTPSTFETQQAVLKVENLKVMLPERLNTDDTNKFKGLLGVYIFSEVEALNEIIGYLGDEVDKSLTALRSGIHSDKLRQLSQDEVPEEWKERTRIKCFTSLHSFSSHVAERHAQLTRCLQEERVSTFDMRLLENPRRLLQAYIGAVACDMKKPTESLCYQFSIGGSGDSSSLCLTNLVMMAGSIDGGSVRPSGAFNVTPIKSLVAKVVPRQENTANTFNVPLYRQAALISDLARTPVHNGESDNFVYGVTLPTSSSEDALLEAGTAMFCRIPEQLT